MWWDQLVQVKYIEEKNVTWKEFKKHFEKKYLTMRYYGKNMKEFFEETDRTTYWANTHKRLKFSS